MDRGILRYQEAATRHRCLTPSSAPCSKPCLVPSRRVWSSYRCLWNKRSSYSSSVSASPPPPPIMSMFTDMANASAIGLWNKHSCLLAAVRYLGVNIEIRGAESGLPKHKRHRDECLFDRHRYGMYLTPLRLHGAIRLGFIRSLWVFRIFGMVVFWHMSVTARAHCRLTMAAWGDPERWGSKGRLDLAPFVTLCTPSRVDRPPSSSDRCLSPVPWDPLPLAEGGYLTNVTASRIWHGIETHDTYRCVSADRYRLMHRYCRERERDRLTHCIYR